MNKKYKDLLGRKDLAVNFVNVILEQDAKVYSINAQWGAGKTYFLRFIEEVCTIKAIPFVSFNIWENDYLNNPFQAVISEVLNLLEILEDDDFLDKEIIKLKNSIKENINKLADFLKRVNYVANISVPIPDANGTVFNTGFQLKPAELNEYNDMKTTKENLIRDLTQIIKRYPSNKIIIAIDELDRCRPDYAIKTLEIIKHFFNIDKLIFIIAVDKEQLKNTVKVLYGLDANTDCYLKKFVDVEYSLPESDIENFIKYLFKDKYPNIYKNIDKYGSEGKILCKSQGKWKLGNRRYSQVSKDILGIIDLFSLNPRDLEKFALKLDIILKQFNETDILCLPLLGRLIMLNIIAQDPYSSLKKGKKFNTKLKLNDDFLEIIDIITRKNLLDSQKKDMKFKELIIQRKKLKSYFNKIDLIKDFSKI